MFPNSFVSIVVLGEWEGKRGNLYCVCICTFLLLVERVTLEVDQLNTRCHASAEWQSSLRPAVAH